MSPSDSLCVCCCCVCVCVARGVRSRGSTDRNPCLMRRQKTGERMKCGSRRNTAECSRLWCRAFFSSPSSCFFLSLMAAGHFRPWTRDPRPSFLCHFVPTTRVSRVRGIRVCVSAASHSRLPLHCFLPSPHSLPLANNRLRNGQKDNKMEEGKEAHDEAGGREDQSVSRWRRRRRRR